MPRFSRVGDAAHQRGLSPVGGTTRGYALPVHEDEKKGNKRDGYKPDGWWVFSRRQFDGSTTIQGIRDQPAPGEARGDAETIKIYRANLPARSVERREPDRIYSNPRVLAAITVLRWDALNPNRRRSDADAAKFAWALKVIYGSSRSIDWSRYNHYRR